MYKLRPVIFIVLCLLGFTRLKAQVEVTSTVTSVDGCVPLVVTFTAPANVTSGTWNFGNGSVTPVSTGAFSYTLAGTYTITYNGTSPSGPVAFSLTAEVHPLPTASFVLVQPASNCAVKTITLVDMSTGVSLTSWNWIYGDGNSYSVTSTASPTHAYANAGNYPVNLFLANVYGCTHTMQAGPVIVYTTPTAVINSNPANLSSCSPPFSAVFSAANSLGPNLSYAWNFGNSQTSFAVTSPQITYNNQGNYNVTLTVTSNGCTSTATQVVVVNPTTLTAAVPPSVCIGAPFTVTVASNQPLTLWNLGGGIVAPVSSGPNSSTATVLGAFTNSGVATITISAGFGACMSSVTQTIFVDQVTAAFASPNPAFSCSSPFNVVLQNQTTPNASQFTISVPAFQQNTLTLPPQTNTLSYQFSGVNPIFTIPLTQGSQNPYSNFHSPYSLAYAPSITLVAASAAGCTHSVVHTYDSITQATASFYKDKMNGCAPLTVTYNSNSYVFAHDPIASYTWCNGATPPSFSVGSGPAIPTQTFMYTTAGTYSPYLIIQTAAGCTDMSFTELVTAADPPVISFNFAPSVVCHNDTVKITNTTAPSVTSTINHWHVESDDGYFSGCISDPNPSWNFTHVGVHGFTMSAYVDGCKTELASVNQVTVNGPVVRGIYETNCTNKMSVNFYSQLQSATAFTIDFGDGSTPYTTTNAGGTVDDFVTHVYPASGDYPVTLTGANASTGCQNSIYSMTVTVRNIQAAVTSTDVVCVNVSTPFTATASVDVLTGCSRGYVWYVDNLPPLEVSTPTFAASFTSAGNHQVVLMVKDLNSCTDTYTQSIRVSSVTPSFTLSSTNICINGTLQAVNTSSSVSQDPLVAQFWDFGNGQYSSVPSPTMSYPVASTPFTPYTIILTVTNSRGCQLSTARTIQVVRPNTGFSASQTNICVGPGNVTFNAQPSGGTYTMNFGQGAVPTLTSSSPVFNHIYTAAGNFNVTLHVKDAQGCEADGGPMLINAQITPTADFSYSSPESGLPVICTPTTIVFADQSQPAQNYTYNWNVYPGTFGAQNPTVTYAYTQTVTETFAITHTVTTSNGCSSVVTKTVTLFSPRAKIKADRTQICLGDPVRFSIIDSTGSGVSGWRWLYGDFSPSASSVQASSSPPTSTLHPFVNYPQNGIAVVELTSFSALSACSFKDVLEIKILKADASFKRNEELARQDSVHCLRVRDSFNNTSPNASVSSFLWGFGNGDISPAQSPQYTYPKPGTYQVTLTVTDPNTCKGIATKNMTVNPLPDAAISAPDSVCQESPFELTGSGTSAAGISKYHWLPSGAVSNPGAAITTAIATSSVPVNYSLSVTDGNDCVSDPVTYSLYIQAPAKQTIWDTTIIVGQQVPMQASQGLDFTYTWNPLADLNCVNCTNPVSTTTVNVTYSVVLEDDMACFRVTNTYDIHIDPQTSVDVPTAFTPNGDGINDVIYADGWGIKKLNYFKIFNRWGQLLFESHDIKTGWDGTFNGLQQNMETYIYQVSVETYLDGEPLLKTSSFKLIR